MAAFVLVVRHPDYDNDVTIDGDVRVIDIDLGSSFSGTPDGAEEALEWARNLEHWLAGVPVGPSVFRDAVEAVSTAVERYDAATDWVDAYVAAREGRA